jgi:hypothetical protein
LGRSDLELSGRGVDRRAETQLGERIRHDARQVLFPMGGRGGSVTTLGKSPPWPPCHDVALRSHQVRPWHATKPVAGLAFAMSEREDPHLGRQLCEQHRVGEAIDAVLSDPEVFSNTRSQRPDVWLGGNSRQRLFHPLSEAYRDGEVLRRVDADSVPILSVGFVVEDERFSLAAERRANLVPDCLPRDAL